MSWRRTILAFLSLVMLLLIVQIDMRIAARRIYETVNEQSLAPGINKSEVDQVMVHNQKGDVLLVREHDKWRIKKPVDAAADPEIVEQLLFNITGARKRNENVVKNLAEFGLAAPEISVGMKTSTGKSFELLLGNESTYTGQVFAKYSTGEKVFTVGEHVRNVLLRGPLDFRRARIVDVDVADLDQYHTISINTGDKAIVVKNDRGSWRVTSPVETPAERDVVHDYLRKVGLLKAYAFLSENSDKPTSVATALQALGKPMLSFTLERSNGPLARLLVANAGESSKPLYVAQRAGDDELLVLRQETVDAVVQDENYFRSRTIFQMKPADVGMFSIEIGRAGARTDLIRNDKGLWEFVGDPKRRVDQDKVNIRIEALLASKVQEYVDTNPRDVTVYGLMPPFMKFTLVSQDKTRTEGLERGKSEPGQVTSIYARRRGDASVFTMEMPAELVILPEHVADRKFASVPTPQVDHFEIEINEKRFAFKKEGEWKVLRPTQTAYTSIDATRVERFFDLLNELEYTKDFAATGETMISPPADEPVAFRIYGQGDTELLDMTLGKKSSEGTLVTADKDRTYEVDTGEIERLLAAARTLIQ